MAFSKGDGERSMLGQLDLHFGPSAGRRVMKRAFPLWIATTVACAAVALAVEAQEATKLDCANPKYQVEMNQCAYLAYQRADAGLKATYGKLMGKLPDDGTKAQLRAAQRAWIAYRDQECAFETSESEGGSMHPMLEAGCLEEKTEARRRELQGVAEIIGVSVPTLYRRLPASGSAA